jgi:glycosyltransferase involved in cell wall biosynthesis
MKMDTAPYDEAAKAPQAAPSMRLNGKLLMMAPVVPPVPIAVAFVVKGLLSQFSPDEVIIAAERWPANPPDQTHGPNGHRIHFIGKQMRLPKRGQRFFEWLRWFQVPVLTFRLIKLARRERCNAIFGHFPDERCLYAAYLASRWLGMPLFPFFHNTYRENRRGLAYWIASWIQRRVFRSSPVVFVMSEGMQTELRKLYPADHFEPLVHTFDGVIPDFQPLPPIRTDRVRLGYLGSVNDANLDALLRFCRIVDHTPHLQLDIYSGVPRWYLEKIGVLGPRTRHEQPTDDELPAKLLQNDVLFLPHGLTGGLSPIEYRTIFPTRTIPYLISGRPILAHSPKDSFLTDWLRRYDCAEVVDVPDEVALQNAIERLSKDQKRREQLVRNALQAAHQFHAPQVVNALKSTINELMPSSRNRSEPTAIYESG